MAITAADVKNLREKTGLGMMECKQALKETDGDVDGAVDLLRQRGLAKMEKRADREAGEGRIAAEVAEDRSRGAIVEVTSETDFTAGNDKFKAMLETVASEALKQAPGAVEATGAMQEAIDHVRLTTKENVQFARGRVLGGAGSVVGAYVHFTGKVGVLLELVAEGGAEVPEALLNDLCMHVAAVSPAPLAITREEIPEALVEKEREVAKAQAIEQGKPEQIAEKMVEGKIRKFYEEHALLEQGFIKDDKQQVQSLLPEGVGIRNFIRFAVGEGQGGEA